MVDGCWGGGEEDGDWKEGGGAEGMKGRRERWEGAWDVERVGEVKG